MASNKPRFLRRLLPATLKPKKYEDISSLLASGKSRNEIYSILDEFYYLWLPMKLVRHRRYFEKYRRGFGEDAFHCMWYLIFSEFRPTNCLEIGVYRGQTLTLWRMISDMLSIHNEIFGISPFSDLGDSVSSYASTIDYLADTQLNHTHFMLKQANYIAQRSDSAEAKLVIESKVWDLIYIDGSHDYEVVCLDLRNAIDNIKKGGVIVMDDSSLNFAFDPPPGSFAGHPGPSRVASEIAQHELNLIGGVGHNNIFVRG
jgi:hypothetical protein